MVQTIQISDELYQKLGSLAKPFTDRPEDVIHRLLDNPLSDKRNHTRISTQSSFMEPKKYIQSKGGRIPYPLELRIQYPKGTFTYGEAKDGYIWFEGQSFKAPSPAAEYVAKTKGKVDPHIDGWRVMDYLDSKTRQWYSLDVLRNGQK